VTDPRQHPSQPFAGAADVGIGIIGPGAIADHHAVVLARLGARLVAVSGPKDEENREFGTRHQIDATYRRPEDMLANDAVDAVIVASPSPVHAEQTTAALRSGKHVLCEIPIALDYATAVEVSHIANSARVVATVAHTLRFWAPHLELRRRVELGELEVRHLIARSLQLRQTNVGWTGRVRDWTDNVLWHHGAHLVDTALWLLDDRAASVSGWRGPPWPASASPMDVAIALRAANGGIATLTLSYHSRLAVSDYLVIAEDRTYRIDDGRLYDGDDVLVNSGGTAATQAAAIEAQDRDFLEAIIGGRRPRLAIDDVLPTMRVLQEIDRSAPGGDVDISSSAR
jgi:2-hydroxy-4-carboxymuconate semialdehyde hemiacetal dehydrogenase